MIDMNRVGKCIKNARTNKNMTQLELADIVGVSYQAVSNWERGNSMPDIAKLSDISKALDIDITEILGDGSSAQAIKKVVDNTPEPLTTKELIALAPMMPPAELREKTEKIMDNEAINMEALVHLAAYLDDEMIDEILSDMEEVEADQLVALAPFLSDDTMANACEKINSPSIRELVALAPFMTEEALNDTVERVNTDDLEGIDALAPFLSNEALDMVVDKAIESDSVSLLSGIGCFLEKKSIKKIVEYLVETKNISEISNFALFI